MGPSILSKDWKSKIQKRQVKSSSLSRVSTEKEDQLHSLLAQKTYYTKLIEENKDWNFVSIFADEELTGTSYKKCPAFNEMIEPRSAELVWGGKPAWRRSWLTQLKQKRLPINARKLREFVRLFLVSSLQRLFITNYRVKTALVQTVMDSWKRLVLLFNDKNWSSFPHTRTIKADWPCSTRIQVSGM